jgi:2-dehydropantoate 2-reductase
MAEVEALGRALGIGPLATTADHLALLGTLRDVRTSMLQDVLAGRTTEVDALMRPVLEIGRRVGIDMPVTQALFGLARFLQPQSSTDGPTSAESAAALSSRNTGDMQ